MGQASSVVSSNEIEVLIEFYTALNGKRWAHQTGWCDTTKEPSEWFGIKEVMGHVIEIELPRNRLSGVIPKSIGKLTHLRVLNLAGNNITGIIPDTIKNLTALRLLDLSCNKLDGPIPAEITRCVCLHKLDLQQNFITGSLPKNLGDLRSMRTLYLQHNKLSGNLPESIGQLTQLVKLSVRGNCMDGSIPKSIGNCQSLEILSLRNNAFTGSIPESLGACESLVCLNLSSNCLSGEIFASIGNLLNLEYLYLFENNLSGIVPTSLSRLRKLKEVNLRQNCDSLDQIPSYLENASPLGILLTNLSKKVNDAFEPEQTDQSDNDNDDDNDDESDDQGRMMMAVHPIPEHATTSLRKVTPPILQPKRCTKEPSSYPQKCNLGAQREIDLFFNNLSKYSNDMLLLESNQFNHIPSGAHASKQTLRRPASCGGNREKSLSLTDKAFHSSTISTTKMVEKKMPILQL